MGSPLEHCKSFTQEPTFALLQFRPCTVAKGIFKNPTIGCCPLLYNFPTHFLLSGEFLPHWFSEDWLQLIQASFSVSVLSEKPSRKSNPNHPQSNPFVVFIVVLLTVLRVVCILMHTCTVRIRIFRCVCTHTSFSTRW